MENRKEFTFPSADGRTAIHAVEWHPAGEPAGILQIAHGVAEYALRYEPFARFLNAHGFLVVANDHLGHGESVDEGAPRLYFGEKGSWQHVVDDMYTLRCRTGEAYPELPYFPVKQFRVITAKGVIIFPRQKKILLIIQSVQKHCC